jgi:hypothetical protein
MRDLYQKDIANFVSELQSKLNKYDIECIESKISISLNKLFRKFV